MSEYKLVSEYSKQPGRLLKAGEKINTVRPHSALGGLAPQEFMELDGETKMQVALTLG